MGSYVKSIDKKHLVGIGMEGFYGDSSPTKIKSNPNSYKLGTDFIANNLNKYIDFATIHAYPDAWSVLLLSLSLNYHLFYYYQSFNFFST